MYTKITKSIFFILLCLQTTNTIFAAPPHDQQHQNAPREKDCQCTCQSFMQHWHHYCVVVTLLGYGVYTDRTGAYDCQPTTDGTHNCFHSPYYPNAYCRPLNATHVKCVNCLSYRGPNCLYVPSEQQSLQKFTARRNTQPPQHRKMQ